MMGSMMQKYSMLVSRSWVSLTFIVVSAKLVPACRAHALPLYPSLDQSNFLYSV